jgi:two-component system, chemotaxis family, protein-glutamate methylesterase/glutaminase
LYLWERWPRARICDEHRAMETRMVRRDVIVVGGSAGSGAVLRRVLPALPADLPAAIFVVTHAGRDGTPYLVEHLQQACPLRVAIAVDGQPIEHGHVYFAPADHHMLVFPGVIRLGRGQRENMARPAVDPLFRSAALAFAGRVIGLVLSGFLNDGAAGLFAIEGRGGHAMAQHPLDSEVPSMPQAALDACRAGEAVRVADLAGALLRHVGEPASADASPDPELDLEVRIALGSRLGSTRLRQLAEPSALSCPHCHGVLSELRTPGPLRYRCQTGHAFTAETALAAQQNEIDEALMIALRVMEERVTLTQRMGHEARNQGRDAMAETYEVRADEYSRYAAVLREAAVRAVAPLFDTAAE